jgi:hypothetical protein
MEGRLPVDSFRYLPRLIAAFYRMTERKPEYPIPWTPLRRDLDRCRFGLITSAGLYQKGVESPFDLEREKLEPTWGDPTYRTIPVGIRADQVGISHLHLNTEDLASDINIQLPIHRFLELAEEKRIGSLASKAYSFMGYQGFPPDTSAWEGIYAPQVAEGLKAESADCVFLTPA